MEKLRIKDTEDQRRQQAYSELMGSSRAKMQIYSAYFSAQINSNYNYLLSIVYAIAVIDYDSAHTVSEIKAELIHEQTNSIYYKEHLIESGRVANYMPLVAEKSKDFFSTLGLIEVLFSNTHDLKDLIQRMETSLGEFSLLTVELDEKSDAMVTKIMNQKMDSAEMRDKFVSEWVPEIDSLRGRNFEEYIKI